jgi:tetratricopeptide (TPR) repeat protein
VKQFKLYIIAFIFLGTLGYAGAMLSSQEPITGMSKEELKKQFKKLLKTAIRYDSDNKFDKAADYYDEIITTPEMINIKLRHKAMLHKADMRITQTERTPNPEYDNQARRLLNALIDAPTDQVHKEDLAGAHLLLGKMDEQGKGSLNNIPDLSSAGKHYTTVINTVAGSISTLIVFKAALHYAELLFRHPEVSEAAENDMAKAYHLMVSLYDKMTPDKKEVVIDDIRDFNDTRLHYAQKLSQGLLLPDNTSGYTKAIELYSTLIQSPERDVYPKTRNRSRVNLAGMYTRGDGLPNNIPDIKAALELYRQVTKEPKANVEPEDLRRAQVGIALAQQRSIQEGRSAAKRQLEQEHLEHADTERKQQKTGNGNVHEQ